MAVEYHSLRELVELAEAQEKFVWEIVQQIGRASCRERV